MTAAPAVGVVGASARAAVLSLARAGFTAWAVDLFADRDLCRYSPCVRCPPGDYPQALPELAGRFPPGPVMYTGGLENAPAVVDEFARRRPLWGIGPGALARVRDPIELSGTLRRIGIDRPAMIAPGEQVPSSGRWVFKPDRSTGGRGVRWAEPGEPVRTGCTAQEFVAGPSMSAQFISRAGRTACLGVTHQLVGEKRLHAGPFAYCGNIGPAKVSDEVLTILSRVGEELGRWGGLRGLWGLDFILRAGRPCPVDLNPRYTAAVEVLEYARGIVPMVSHAAEFGDGRPRAGTAPRITEHEEMMVGKAVYFAPRDVVFPGEGPWEAGLVADPDTWRPPDYADIPRPGERIPAGQPVLTFFASDSTAAGCRAKLERRAAGLDRLFLPGPGPELSHDSERTREPGGGRAGAVR